MLRATLAAVPPPSPAPAAFLAIQLVEIRHGKQHRGAAGAQLRATLPRALPLPIVGERGVLHRCSMSAWDGFAPTSAADEPPVRDASVVLRHAWRIELHADRLTLHSHAHARVGSPALLVVPHGRWARLRCNSRERGFEDSWYAELTLNFGGFPAQPGQDVFLGEPDSVLDLRRDLLRRGRRRIR